MSEQDLGDVNDNSPGAHFPLCHVVELMLPCDDPEHPAMFAAGRRLFAKRKRTLLAPSRNRAAAVRIGAPQTQHGIR